MSKLFDKISQQVPEETSRYIARSMDVSDQITEILKRKGITQRQLAERLGKNESEISKWLSGNHNFTLRTLAKIESILEEDVLVAPIYWKEYNGMFAFNEKDFIFKTVHHGTQTYHKYAFPKEQNFNFDDIVPEKIVKGKVCQMYPEKDNPRFISTLWQQRV